ncbi:30S ribosomal protein S27e [Candidatus Bathyarchaeota archaeon ex4484_205]|nr:MAG: 30S ribosomal protein S27e [Candidatus Bathyarchaeota archaeon ex4484_205]RLG69090.1 MAG: 30S ribosomal protein S27e [archaeon]
MELVWRKLIPQPRSKFYEVECPECGSTMSIFSHAATIIRCEVCGKIMAEPTGGKAKIYGKIIRTLE